MGYDAYGYAVLGVKIPASSIVREIPFKKGNHDFPESVKFHPETGRKLWDTYTSTIWEDKEGDFDPPKEYGLSTIIGDHETIHGESAYIGVVSKSGSKLEVNEEIIVKTKTKLKRLLGDLYDESDFGIYGATYHSY